MAPVHQVHADLASPFPLRQVAVQQRPPTITIVDDGIGCPENAFDRAAAQHARLLSPERMDREYNRQYDQADAQQLMLLQDAAAAVVRRVSREREPRRVSREREPGNILGYDSARSFEMRGSTETELPNPQEEEELWQASEATKEVQAVPPTHMDGVDTEARPRSNTSEGTEEPQQWPWHQTHGEPSASSIETILLQRQQQLKIPERPPDSLEDTREAQAMVEALREFDVQISTKGNFKTSLQAVAKSKYPPNNV